MGAQNFETQMRTQILVIRVQLPLGWNTYLLFNTDTVNFEWKTDEAETESICFVNFVFWQCLNCQWMGDGAVGKKVLFKAS